MKTALDVPTGGGAIAKFMVEQLGLKVEVSDIDQAKYEYSAPFQLADLGRKLPYPDSSFDLTVCMEGLKHVSDLEGAMRELSRVTKKGGYVLLTIPNDLCLQSRFAYLFHGFVDIDWKCPFPPDHQNVKDFLYLRTLISLPYLYFFIASNGLRMVRTAACHRRFWSYLLMIPLYPFIFLAVSKHVSWNHPLFREMISPVWLTGKRNLILCQKN